MRLVVSVCLSVLRQFSKTKRDRRERNVVAFIGNRDSGSLSKNMTPDFAPEVAKYPKSSRKPQNSPKWGSRYLNESASLGLLFCSVSDAACYMCIDYNHSSHGIESRGQGQD